MRANNPHRERRALRHPAALLAVGDTFSWVFAIAVASIFRYEFSFASLPTAPLLGLSLVVVIVSLAAGLTTHLYRNRFVTGSLDELRALVSAAAGVTMTVGIVVALWGNGWGLPRSIVLLAAPLFLLFAGGGRALWRTQRLRRSARRDSNGTRTLIYGAGAAAESIIRQLTAVSNPPFVPIAMLDDSPAKANRWINGIATRGNWDNLSSVTRRYSIEVVIVAIPTATSALLQRVYKDCYTLGLRVVVLPSLREYLGGNKSAAQLKEVGIDDLIGRQSVELDPAPLKRFLAGKKVLVTGAGGSIGSELTKQIGGFLPKQLVLVDRDETGLLMAEAAARREESSVEYKTYLCDIRDVSSVETLFEKYRPEVVFHAAALKHLPMLEKFPSEAWKTNVEGTLNVLTAAQTTGVGALVNISTDKAADPVSVLGTSKKLAEEMTAWMAEHTGLGYVSVRFGNVLGSRGSLVPVLAEQIGSNGPVTLTHKDATRYFMSISEACQLVLQASTVGKPGDILVLDMGRPVKIQEIAERMIELSGKTIEIIYTGLRPGEKLHEDLLSTGETALESDHPKILRLKGQPKNPMEVLGSAS